MSTLYERLGGEAAVAAAVVRFYEKIMDDTLLAPFFEGVEMDRLIEKQIGFMTLAFDGPSRYTGRDLRVAHAPLLRRGLRDVHFDGLAGHLAETLRELAITEEVVAEVLAILETTRKDVFSR